MLENRTGITKENIKDSVKNISYNQGRIRVKPEYINSLKLFDVTYGCRMGNGCVSSHEGSLYRGRGYIQITGKAKYIEITNKWNELYPDDPKDFVNADREKMVTDIEIAIKVSMIEWMLRNLNGYADVGISDDAIDDVGSIVNGSRHNLPNDYKSRRAKTRAIFKVIK